MRHHSQRPSCLVGYPKSRVPVSSNAPHLPRSGAPGELTGSSGQQKIAGSGGRETPPRRGDDAAYHPSRPRGLTARSLPCPRSVRRTVKEAGEAFTQQHIVVGEHHLAADGSPAPSRVSDSDGTPRLSTMRRRLSAVMTACCRAARVTGDLPTKSVQNQRPRPSSRSTPACWPPRTSRSSPPPRHSPSCSRCLPASRWRR
jgi:hypothetical protein